MDLSIGFVLLENAFELGFFWFVFFFSVFFLSAFFFFFFGAVCCKECNKVEFFFF